MGALIGRKWHAVLLDLDGTLIDSEPTHKVTFDVFFAARGWTIDDDTKRHFVGRRASDVFATTHGPWSGEDPYALMAEVLSYMDHDAAPPVPTPGAIAFISALQSRSIPLALVTSANRAWAEYATEEILGTRDAFNALITWEDVTHGKPDPAPYLAASRALHVDPGHALAIEDTDAGIHSALNAGIGRVVGVTTTYDSGFLRNAGAHAVVDSLDELTH